MLIGICGKSGSGKSTLSNEFIRLYGDNVVHLDIDKIGHKVLELEEVKKDLIDAFGNSIINGNAVDRKRLSSIVFSSTEAMQTLTDITWKYMQMQIDRIIASCREKIIILDWILLPKTKYFNMCNFRILLDIPYEVRKARAMKRDNITEEAFALRDSASDDFDPNSFDYVTNNNDLNFVKRVVKLI